jgi:hypothetical protein
MIINFLYFSNNEIHVTAAILEINHNPIFYLKHDVSETGLCLLLETENSSVCWVELSRIHLKTNTEYGLRNAEF